MADLLVLVLHWIFVDKKELHSKRRPVATFGLSLVEIATVFAVIFALT